MLKKLPQLLQNKAALRWLYAGMLLLSLLFIGLALRANWTELTAQSWRFDYRYILLSVLLYPAGMLPTVAGWHVLLQALGVWLPFRSNLRYYSLSSLPRHIPGFVWYVSSRSVLYRDDGVPAGVTIAATGAEVILLALTGFITATLLLLLRFEPAGSLASLPLISLAAAGLLVALLLFAPLLNRSLHRLMEKRGVQPVPQIDTRRLALALFWMFLAWAGGGLILLALAQAVLPLSWALLPVFAAIWGAAGAVSLTVGIGIGGLGIRELTLGALLSLVVPPLAAVALAVAFRLVLTLAEVLWVLFFIWISKRPSKRKEGLAPDSNQ